jgi:hypothetical protein
VPTQAKDPLQKYRSKRDFATTSEPCGGERELVVQRSFVVQKHAARRLLGFKPQEDER